MGTVLTITLSPPSIVLLFVAGCLVLSIAQFRKVKAGERLKSEMEAILQTQGYKVTPYTSKLMGERILCYEDEAKVGVRWAYRALHVSAGADVYAYRTVTLSKEEFMTKNRGLLDSRDCPLFRFELSEVRVSLYSGLATELDEVLPWLHNLEA